MTSPTFLGINITFEKAHKLRVILLILLHEGHVSRGELAGKTSLSATTITNLSDELISQGMVIENPNEVLPGQRWLGHPRRTLRLDPSAQGAQANGVQLPSPSTAPDPALPARL
jgi:hypothetical protein